MGMRGSIVMGSNIYIQRDKEPRVLPQLPTLVRGGRKFNILLLFYSISIEVTFETLLFFNANTFKLKQILA